MSFSVEIFPVGFNDLLIPEEGFFSFTMEVTVAVVVPVDIDKSITLLHLTGGQGNEVNTSPWRIGDDIHAVINRFPDLFNVFLLSSL